jgi:peptidoglycan/xylan/chitin deacetylase (PgdA/CDA1 family)
MRFASPKLSRVFGAGRAVVLKYHSVLAAPDPMRPGETTADEFDAQMGVVAAAFGNETFGDYIRSRGARSRRENTVVVTFDDGYKDNHDVALPILRKHGIRATIFVASQYLAGGAMWNDRFLEAMRASVGRSVDLEEAGLGKARVASLEDASGLAQRTLSSIKRWPQARRERFVDEFVKSCDYDGGQRVMLNASEVAALAEAGMEIGAHTVSHPILSTLSADESWKEIADSKAALERVLGRGVATFAYPNGRPNKDFTDADVERVKRAGYIGAVTTRWACATAAADAFQVPRQGIWGANRAKLWLRLMRNFRK